MWLTTLGIQLDAGYLHAARVGDEVTVCGEVAAMELRYRWPLGPDWPVCGECAVVLLSRAGLPLRSG